MNYSFTSTPPTTPGWFAWKQPDGQMGSLYLNQRDLDCRLTMTAFERMKLEWCRLVPAEEIEKAWDESREGKYNNAYDSWSFDTSWSDSRAKRIMEGKE